jgi:pimeloyl-ACP methyl ester carboxylesterase
MHQAGKGKTAVVGRLLFCLVDLLQWSILWALFWRAFYRVHTREETVHFVTTADGWRLALARYPPLGASRRRFPVLLCHGLGANRCSFDLGRDPSLAVYLANAGFDVWCLELRGHGRSDRPGLFSPRHFGWSFDDYLHIDLPTAIAKVQKITGMPQLHVVGHSMGGMLCLCHCATASEIRSATVIAASLDFRNTGSDFARLLKGKWLAHALPAIPVGLLALMVSPCTGRIKNRLEEFSLWGANVDPMVTRLHFANTFHAISSPVLLQLSTAFAEGGFHSWNGAQDYRHLTACSRVPTLFLAADRDRQCPLAACRRTYERLAQGGEAHQLVVFGKKTGQQEHYGHFDLLLGQRAATEVFPEIASWLLRHDAHDDAP